MFTADHTGAASSSLVYEKYESTEGNVFKDDAIDVKSYIQIRHAVAMAPNSAEAEGKMEIPGEIVNSKTYRTATETGKKIGRTILKGMRKSELAGLCYTDFSIADVFVSTSGKAKLKGVRRIKFCMTQQFNNYGAVCAIMTELFTLNGQIPAEIQRLINLMRTRFDLRFMYHLHGSLVPIARSTLLYKTLYEQLEISTMDKARKDVILLGLPLLSQWKGLVATNWLLKCTFDHKQKEYNDGLGRYTHPPLPLQATARQRLDRKLLEAQDFLDYLRNRGAHRMEYLGHFYTRSRKKYTADGSDRACEVRFAEVTCYLQEQLSDQIQQMNTSEIV